MPSAIGVCASYPSNDCALEMSAYVRGTSPGWSGISSMLACLPVALSIILISSLNLVVAEPPRLKISNDFLSYLEAATMPSMMSSI